MNFSFYESCFSAKSKKSSMALGPENFLLRFFPKSLKVLSSIFKSTIHFGLMYVKSMRFRLRLLLLLLFFFADWCLIIPAPNIEKSIFISLNCFDVFVKDHLNLFVWLFLDSLFCPIDLSTSIACSWLLGYSLSGFFFFFQYCFCSYRACTFLCKF